MSHLPHEFPCSCCLKSPREQLRVENQPSYSGLCPGDSYLSVQVPFCRERSPAQTGGINRPFYSHVIVIQLLPKGSHFWREKNPTGSTSTTNFTQGFGWGSKTVTSCEILTKNVKGNCTQAEIHHLLSDGIAGINELGKFSLFCILFVLMKLSNSFCLCFRGVIFVLFCFWRPFALGLFSSSALC